jgi:hypothetical protein
VRLPIRVAIPARSPGAAIAQALAWGRGDAKRRLPRPMGQNGSMKLSKLGEDVTETRPDRCWVRALSQTFLVCLSTTNRHCET